MHFVTLVTVDIPKTEDDPLVDMCIQEKIKVLEAAKAGEHDFIADYYIRKFNSLSNAFGRSVNSEIDLRLEPYGEQTENPAYLEFEDHTEELQKEYENDTVDCIKLPGGRLISIETPGVWDKFIIGEDGKVYQKYFGPLKHPKRSKRAKKMTGIKNYPYNKLYKTFNDFAEYERYISYNEDYKGYGYVYNPNAFYDWYVIGGRWPFLFLVKDTCEEYSIGERSWGIKNEISTPKGYRWVCAARKKDIQWKAMFEYEKNSAVNRFHTLEKAFMEKKFPEHYHGSFTDEGIRGFREMLYKKGETVQQYLARNRIIRKYKYPDIVQAYLDSNGEYCDKDFINLKDYDKKNRIWHKALNKFIDSLDDEIVLVGVDCHI